MDVPKADILLFDGVCNLCNGAVQFVIKRDKKKIFRFASLQSSTGMQILQQIGLPQDHRKSFVYIDRHGKVYNKSAAALRVAAQLGFPVSIISVFKLVPSTIRDFFYDLIARNRYKWFGKKTTCMIPSQDLKSRFLE